MLNDVQDRLIDELFAWVCVDPKTGLEGICGFVLPGSGLAQAASSSRAAVEWLRPEIMKAKQQTGKNFKLIRFGKPEIIEEL